RHRHQLLTGGGEKPKAAALPGPFGARPLPHVTGAASSWGGPFSGVLPAPATLSATHLQHMAPTVAPGTLSRGTARVTPPWSPCDDSGGARETARPLLPWGPGHL